MANYFSVVRMQHDQPAAQMEIGHVPDSDPHRGIMGLINFLAGVLCGSRHAKLEVVGQAVQAACELNFGTTDGNVTVNGVNIAYTGADANARAADALAAINASANALVKDFVLATVGSAASKVNLIAGPLVIGVAGNAVTVAISGTGASITGGLTRLGSGSETKRTWKRGY